MVSVVLIQYKIKFLSILKTNTFNNFGNANRKWFNHHTILTTLQIDNLKRWKFIQDASCCKKAHRNKVVNTTTLTFFKAVKISYTSLLYRRRFCSFHCLWRYFASFVYISLSCFLARSQSPRFFHTTALFNSSTARTDIFRNNADLERSIFAFRKTHAPLEAFITDHWNFGSPFICKSLFLHHWTQFKLDNNTNTPDILIITTYS